MSANNSKAGEDLRKLYAADPDFELLNEGMPWGRLQAEHNEKREERHARGEYSPKVEAPPSPPRQSVSAYLPPRRPYNPGYRQPYRGPQQVGAPQRVGAPQAWLRVPPSTYNRRAYSPRRRSPSPRRRSPRRSPSPRRRSPSPRRRSPSPRRSPPRYSRRSPPRYSRRSPSPRRGTRRSPSGSPSSVNSFGRMKPSRYQKKTRRNSGRR